MTCYTNFSRIHLFCSAIDVDSHDYLFTFEREFSGNLNEAVEIAKLELHDMMPECKSAKRAYIAMLIDYLCQREFEVSFEAVPKFIADGTGFRAECNLTAEIDCTVFI